MAEISLYVEFIPDGYEKHFYQHYSHAAKGLLYTRGRTCVSLRGPKTLKTRRWFLNGGMTGDDLLFKGLVRD